MGRFVTSLKLKTTGDRTGARPMISAFSSGGNRSAPHERQIASIHSAVNFH